MENEEYDLGGAAGKNLFDLLVNQNVLQRNQYKDNLICYLFLAHIFTGLEICFSSVIYSGEE